MGSIEEGECEESVRRVCAIGEGGVGALCAVGEGERAKCGDRGKGANAAAVVGGWECGTCLKMEGECGEGERGKC